MMVEARKDADKATVADNAAEVSRIADASARLFAEQAAAMAVMTVYGIRVASEMTSMMLGALRGPVVRDGSPEPVEKAPEAKVVPLRPQAPAAAETAATAVPQAGSMRARKATIARTAKADRNKPLAPKRTTRSASPVKDARPAPSGHDDLKVISGIGPRLELVLNERGIARYADLAALGKAALKKLDVDLGLEGRVIRDDWAGQAKALSGGKG